MCLIFFPNVIALWSFRRPLKINILLPIFLKIVIVAPVICLACFGRQMVELLVSFVRPNDAIETGFGESVWITKAFGLGNVLCFEPL